MAVRNLNLDVHEWFLEEQSRIDECANELLEAGFATNVYRLPANGGKKRYMEIHLPDPLPAIQAEIGNWVVWISGTLPEVLTPEEHEARFPRDDDED
ncbi:hypothetical protein [Mycolicibacterium phlei]|uniref:hypothetical protein n=1 Tax=Mycolicibacterium phlei TaxID=1771 RepID=UPI0002D7BE11|nr:hypothetical protein [Mycolicibacterium phlei]MBF4194680.1 hypothetical protein [Mycolicibacterium phlei]